MRLVSAWLHNAMGAGGSVPDALDEAQAKELAGNRWDQRAFDARKGADGKITKAQLEAAAVRLPASLDEVDAEFIASALRCAGCIGPDIQVKSFEKIKYGREKGYLGDKCLLRNIAYEREGGVAFLSTRNDDVKRHVV